MKFFKKNQVIVYVIALMLMTAGYLNYSSNEEDSSVETSVQIEAKDDSQLADIGDAKLVNSNDVVESDNNDKNEQVLESNSDNTVVNNNSDKEEQVMESNSGLSKDYFDRSKLERDSMFSQMIESYESILNGANSSEVQKQTASQEIAKINDVKNKIMICESLIEIKGFENSVVFVNGESVSVVVATSDSNSSSGLKPEEVAQIQNIVSREIGAKIENIHISNK